MVLIGAVIGYFFMKMILIFSTSTIGSYAAVRGVSLVAGGFPSESLIIDLIKKQEFKEFDKILTGVVYAYLGSWLVITIVAIVFQYWHNKDLKDEDMHYKKHDDNDE